MILDFAKSIGWCRDIIEISLLDMIDDVTTSTGDVTTSMIFFFLNFLFCLRIFPQYLKTSLIIMFTLITIELYLDSHMSKIQINSALKFPEIPIFLQSSLQTCHSHFIRFFVFKFTQWSSLFFSISMKP